MPLLDHFDILAPLYERVIPSGDTKELFARLRLPSPGALLDAGGGTGRVAQALRGSAGPVIVADLSFRMLAEARRKGGLLPVCAHTENLPFPGGCFPRIIMVDALHHVCDPHQTASELWRVLRPGGRLVIQEPDVRFLAVKLVALGEKLALMRSRFLAPHRIAHLFRNTGARVRTSAKNSTAWITAEKAGGKDE
jgi:ubiquinone/menaquinone biosynthesis C-methylase UbiE